MAADKNLARDLFRVLSYMNIRFGSTPNQKDNHWVEIDKMDLLLYPLSGIESLSGVLVPCGNLVDTPCWNQEALLPIRLYNYSWPYPSIQPHNRL